MPLHLRLPDDLGDDATGDLFIERLTAARFTNVDVAIVGDDLVVNVDGCPDPLPPGEERDACQTQDELDTLIASYREETQSDYDDLRGRVAAALGFAL